MCFHVSIMSLVNPTSSTYVFKGSWWSPEREYVELPTAPNVVNEGQISRILSEGRKHANDRQYLSDLMDKAYEFSTLKSFKACELKDEYV